jgi:hypothetical protein
MKLSILVFLVIGATLIFFGCSENNPSAPGLSQSDQVTNSLAKKPLTGIVHLDFIPGPPPYFWVGTVTFGTEIYDLRFKSLGEDPPPFPPRAFVFDERFEIYDNGFLGDPEHLLLEGPNAGVVPCGNNKFVANGKVEFAKPGGPLEEWLGRNVHTNGIITWVVPCVFPLGATATLRIN